MHLKSIIKFLANLATPIDIATNLSKWRFKNKLLRLTGMTIGNQVAIGPGFQCITGNERNIIIQDYVAIGHNVRLYGFDKITIGSFTTIAADVTITNGNHDISTFEPSASPTVIGKGCWIGHGAHIVRSVHIGDNVIIAAGAIVTKDVPSGSIVMGVPARVTKVRDLPNKVWFLGNIFFNPITFQIVP
jgi:acetyltransferase-like isoleucine patch superfamily enzyme